MADRQRKKGLSAYILPTLFCGLLILLAVLKGRKSDTPVKAVLQAAEPLTLTEQAIENYLYADGFLLQGETILDGDGTAFAALTVTRDAVGEIEALALSYSVPAFVETENSASLSSLKADHDRAIQQGETLFLSLFDAITTTDARVAARRDSALEKLKRTIDTGKAAAQSANSWRFDFSLSPGELAGTVHIHFVKVK